MKRPAYITALILSLLIIYSGGGVSIVRYCCARCEAVQGDCDTGCPKCKKAYTCDSKKTCKGKKEKTCKGKGCKEKGCTAAIYKIDLMKHSAELTVSAMATGLLCEHFCCLLTLPYADKPVECDSLTSPPPLCSRQKLALYSTYII